MIKHPPALTNLFASDDAGRVLQCAMRILEEVGIVIQSKESRELLSAVGAAVDERTQRVRLASDIVTDYLAKAPSRWTLHARNPARNVEIGGGDLLVSPGYGSAFVADGHGTRRTATMDDFRKFALLAGHSENVDITGGLLVEPSDVPTELRPVELTAALVSLSDKPLLGSVAGAQGARDSIEVMRIIMGDLAKKPSLLGLININSPLRLDARMADALLEYAKAGQPVLLTPGILMGITAPVTAVGALAQAFAELMSVAVLAQVAHPGLPVILGIGGFGSNMRTAGPGFGRPENAMGTFLGAQLARRLHLPFRCSAAVTGSMLPDCRSGYERMMTAQCAWNAGAHVCLQAAGILDSINSMCCEQFMIDLEVWGYLKRLAMPLTVNDDTLAFDAIASKPAEYLGHDHTVSHFRDELHSCFLAGGESYDQWKNSGGKDVVARAADVVRKTIASIVPPELSGDIRKELACFVSAKRQKFGGPVRQSSTKP